MVVSSPEVETHGRRLEEDGVMNSRLALELAKELEKSLKKKKTCSQISSSTSQLCTGGHATGSGTEAALDASVMVLSSLACFHYWRLKTLDEVSSFC